MEIYINMHSNIKKVINANCLTTDDQFLLNKKDSPGVISII